MQVAIHPLDGDDQLKLPYFEAGVNAGEPGYVSEYFESSINLNRELVDNPKASFCVRVAGQSMVDAGIDDGDLLIVDRSREPEDGQIILAVINGEYTVKRLKFRNGECFLQPENKAYEPIRITQFMDFRIWGVVTGLIKKVS